jgi:putative ABC transport system substrate-binding protein
MGGQNIALELRFTDGRPETLPRLAAEVVHLGVSVLVAVGPAAVTAAKDATSSIPVVAIDLESDPVLRGFVRSLARPAGNITGLFLDLPGLTGKWLELLREVVPALTRVAALWDPMSGTYQASALRSAARTLGVEIQMVEIHDPERYGQLLANAMKGRPRALVQLSSPLVFYPSYVKQIVDFTLRNRLPAISPFKHFAEAGGLMAYGPDQAQFFGRAAIYVDRILKGAKPADLPVERPNKYDLVINIKTAKAIGLTIAPSLLLRVDQAIE